MDAQRKPLDATAVSVMVLLCLIWGIGHVAAKFAAEGISLVFQSGVRSVVATVLLLAWGWYRGLPLWDRDGTFWPGLFAGLLFAAEFVFIFAGLAMTDAARMVVFIYLAPCITAFGLHFLIAQERLNLRQWAGILVAFGGVAVAFGDGFASGRGTLLGDFFGVLGALFWALTTILIRATRLASVSARQDALLPAGGIGPGTAAGGLADGRAGDHQNHADDRRRPSPTSAWWSPSRASSPGSGCCATTSRRGSRCCPSSRRCSACWAACCCWASR